LELKSHKSIKSRNSTSKKLENYIRGERIFAKYKSTISGWKWSLILFLTTFPSWRILRIARRSFRQRRRNGFLVQEQRARFSVDVRVEYLRRSSLLHGIVRQSRLQWVLRTVFGHNHLGLWMQPAVTTLLRVFRLQITSNYSSFLDSFRWCFGILFELDIDHLNIKNILLVC